MNPTKISSVVLGIFIAVLAVAWFTHGSGVIQNNPDKNIHIPNELVMPLQIKAAYNTENVYFRYRWPASQPHIYHDLLVYQDGKWIRKGKSTVGPEPEGIYEDRLTMLVDDGSIPEFARYGGYITIGDGMRFFTHAAGKKAVQAHPYLGEQLHKKDVRKYLPETRSDPNDWSTVVPVSDLQALREAGYFLDLWHWRAHRSNPIGKSDDQYVAEYRKGDKGKGVYFTNWDKKNKRPKYMYSEGKTKFKALKWDDIKTRQLGFNDIYYLAETDITDFDPEHKWQNGDTLPRKILRPGSNSHADINVHGLARWKDGYWDVTLVRKLDTGNVLDDKQFKHGGVYSIAVAVHRDATGSRWHYVSLPVQLGLGRDAALQAIRFSGAEPQWSTHDWLDMTLFYPGQVGWPLITGKMHAGAKQVHEGVPVHSRHTELQLAQYGVEMEFAEEIIRQWWLTLFAGLALVLSLATAMLVILKRGDA